MADKKRDQQDMKMTDIDAHRKGGDLPRDRIGELSGMSIGANEEEQTRERERAGRDHTDEVGEITETELDEEV